MAKPQRPQPNAADPLSEPTPLRRLWAAYRRAGYTRASFARALDMTYHGLDAWDTERCRAPDLFRFAQAAKLVGLTVDELLYGHAERTRTQALAQDAHAAFIAELKQL